MNKDNDSISDVWQVANEKPHKIKIKVGGDIYACCDGKNVWDEAMKTLIPQILDVNVLSWEGHALNSLKKLRATLDKEFEYDDNELSIVRFKNVVKRWLKIERSKLKTSFLEGKIDYPINIELL